MHWLILPKASYFDLFWRWVVSGAKEWVCAVPWKQPRRDDVYGGVAARPRESLLQAVLRFVLEAQNCRGVRRIALIGSLATSKSLPKEADVLVTIEDGLDLGPLAAAGRRLKGLAQQINLGADIFLADTKGR